LQEALEAFNAPPDVLASIQERQRQTETHFEVEAENWDTLMVFLNCSTQWKKQYAGMSGELIVDGLDYPGVKIVIWGMGYRGKKARDIFAGVQTMEYAALPVLNKRK
jgi:hypothetical protein